MNYLKSVPDLKEFCQYGNLEMAARWGYITNITQHNEEAMVSQEGRRIKVSFERGKFDQFDKRRH